MKLSEYIRRLESIEEDFPPPKGLDFGEELDHYKAIKGKWRSQLSEKDREIIARREKRFEERMNG